MKKRTSTKTNKTKKNRNFRVRVAAKWIIDSPDELNKVFNTSFKIPHDRYIELGAASPLKFAYPKTIQFIPIKELAVFKRSINYRSAMLVRIVEHYVALNCKSTKKTKKKPNLDLNWIKWSGIGIGAATKNGWVVTFFKGGKIYTKNVGYVGDMGKFRITHFIPNRWVKIDQPARSYSGFGLTFA